MTCHPRLSFAPLRPNPAQRVFSEQQAAALGHGDLLKTGKRREGCLDLLEAVSTRPRPPRYHVFGHIHEGYGVDTDQNRTTK